MSRPDATEENRGQNKGAAGKKEAVRETESREEKKTELGNTKGEVEEV